jgi:hypothetical protein
MWEQEQELGLEPELEPELGYYGTCETMAY